MLFRIATTDDIDTLVQLRKNQLIDEGNTPQQDIGPALTAFFSTKMRDGSLVEWVCVEDQTIIATAAVLFSEFPPTYRSLHRIKGYVTNMYTAPAYRGRGIATALLDRLVLEAKARNAEQLWLGASEMGRPVYLRYGFRTADKLLELSDLSPRPCPPECAETAQP